MLTILLQLSQILKIKRFFAHVLTPNGLHFKSKLARALLRQQTRERAVPSSALTRSPTYFLFHHIIN